MNSTEILKNQINSQDKNVRIPTYIFREVSYFVSRNRYQNKAFEQRYGALVMWGFLCQMIANRHERMIMPKIIIYHSYHALDIL